MEKSVKNETIIQTITAIIIALIINTIVINPLYAFGVLTINDVVIVNLIMTVTSMIRSYLVRRSFSDKKQSKKMSLIETLTNAGIGLITGYVTYYLVIIPLCNNGTMECDNAIVITLIMTIVSMARTYLVRHTFKRTDKPT